MWGTFGADGNVLVVMRGNRRLVLLRRLQHVLKDVLPGVAVEAVVKLLARQVRVKSPHNP
jgi:hypothetical protein